MLPPTLLIPPLKYHERQSEIIIIIGALYTNGVNVTAQSQQHLIFIRLPRQRYTIKSIIRPPENGQ